MKVIFYCAFFTFLAVLMSSCKKAENVKLTVSFVPELLRINGKPTLYYELHVRNTSNDSITLTKLDVIDTSASKFFVSFIEDDLQSRIATISSADKTEGTTLRPHGSALIYLELSLPEDEREFELVNRLEFEAADKKLNSVQVTIPHLSSTKIILGPPVKEGPWAAIYDPSWERGHRRVVYSVDSVERIPGRFAIDFIKLDADGKFAHDDFDSVRNWFGYGLDVIAVADGIVADTNNDFAESETVTGHIEQTPQKATGNYVVIDLGNSNFAFYEHLKPSSIRVKAGDKVRRGDILGSIGFTGNTTGPHLHFHVANRNSALGAEGIAFAFDRFVLLGAYQDLQEFGSRLWTETNLTDKTIVNEHPGPNSVIMY